MWNGLPYYSVIEIAYTHTSMIPLSLSINGFLSYRDQVEVDLSGLSLACISGPNGAGKSSLLDAITWSLFGQARKRDDSLINTQSNAAEVVLIFSYEDNIYRIQRTKPRDKVTRLELNILQNVREWNESKGDTRPVWKSLTEGTLRDTEGRLASILRLDYETFVNASFFLQGKADQFTQQRPGDRKRILSSILGLEVWDAYRQAAADRRKSLEGELSALDGRLEEINLELAEEKARIERLAQLEADLSRLAETCQAQDLALQSIKKVAATLEEQRKLVSSQERQVEAACRRLELEIQKEQERLQERGECMALLARAEEVETAYQSWQQARQDLEKWEEVAAHFREQEKRRQGPLNVINEERVRLESEIGNLEVEKQKIECIQKDLPVLNKRSLSLETSRHEIQKKLEERSDLEARLNQARQNQADARAENPRLKEKMEELRDRIDRLSAVEDPLCPLCGQPMSQEERLRLMEDLQEQGKEMGDRYRVNLAYLKEADNLVRELEGSIKALSNKEKELAGIERELDRVEYEVKTGERQAAEWQEVGLPKLNATAALLKTENYAPEARTALAELDAELKAIGYDAAAHDQVRREEAGGRSSEAELRQLERAWATMEALEREINEIKRQVKIFQDEFNLLDDEHKRSAAALLEAEAQAPDLYETERAFYALQEQENQLQMEVGAARQKVLVLGDLKNRKKNLSAQRETLARRVGQLRYLERAFGKDGVPALLIEQALPQIESRANELLERLSAGSMSVRFVTQAAYKDKRRDDLRETLEIQISDTYGTRDYEMYSGGEAFRVNFAIRLALSEVLAQRAGARLQTLVIDEGFGSQDTQGRQRLVEAINQVRNDFALVLVITHIDELRDAFPARIEVEKTARGSRVKIV
jgi:DNA repair protein SbcC/Rad50